ncbi:TetR/AcrR family transcriptional regulator [Amycolatopsis sp. H20-H5]|uniref:TetR/AcrR family transcriptional regulator n=1 Tax=Amycolatopsis sp. H20-H5 TaxID=3046309 RepID=UPI002DB9717D|nr:TetR/AcrR family transcriptional regulator [Amycolatopsis sp. H20-H5]MEC3982368.1 TetR/AcrR family transcriptional regulator [Amycolatopsis sp. H20-H5]
MPASVSRQQYFETALDVLAESGFPGLTIGRLCAACGVTSGSFYHHFGGWPGFVVALLEFWEDRQALLLRELAFGTGGPEADFAALMRLTHGLRHRAEAAIRAWAMNEETVRAAQKRVDEARLKTVGKVIGGLVGDAVTAKVVTAFGMAMLVGHQQLASAGEDTDLGELLDEYTRLVHSHAPGLDGPASRWESQRNH